MSVELPQTCQVARLSKPGGPFELEDVRLPELRRGEALLKVEACTVCASDLRTFRGERAAPSSGLLGHEIVGRIVAGKGDQFTIGERVVCGVAASCGSCRNCTRGIPQKCFSLKKFGHAAAHDDWQLSGGFGEYCHLPVGSALAPAPDSCPPQQSAWLGCAGATAAAATRIAGELRDHNVVVLGTGAVGLFVVAMAAQAGARVLAIDRRESRLKLAQATGAISTHVVDDVSLLDFVMANTESRGADVVFETSGANASVTAATTIAGIGGRVILAGSVAPTGPVPIQPEKIVTSLLRIEGIHNYTPADLTRAVEFAAHQANESFPTFPLGEIDAAFDAAQSGENLRVAVVPGNH
ncbi:MAG: zinc-binding dehydrogenase [Limisphaerales bacterium]